VHNGFVEIDSEKMSKSIGNVLLVQELLKRHRGETIRMALINARYREPLNWDEQLLIQAKAQLDRLYGALERLRDVEIADVPAPSAAFCAAMDDDLNSAQAIATLMEAATRANTAVTADEQCAAKSALIGGGAELGILQSDASAWFAPDPGGDLDVGRITHLIEERTRARHERNWARADAIRDELAALGVQIQDGPDGTQWRT
jgi:cysteinyl-tRNA synthetase